MNETDRPGLPHSRPDSLSVPFSAVSMSSLPLVYPPEALLSIRLRNTARTAALRGKVKRYVQLLAGLRWPGDPLHFGCSLA